MNTKTSSGSSRLRLAILAERRLREIDAAKPRIVEQPDVKLLEKYDWRRHGRPEQFEPPGDDWFVWLILAGRGWGKTRTGAEWAREQAYSMPGSIGALISETGDEVHDYMIQGESGLLDVSPPWFTPKVVGDEVRWPNGSKAIVLSAFKYDSPRGPQQHWAWADELAKWSYASEAWSNLKRGTRLPPRSKICVTTTPRGIPLLKELVKKSTTRVTRGHTLDNRANLSAEAIAEAEETQATREGRQEVGGELLEDIEGALWTLDMLDGLRCGLPEESIRRRVVVAVDPSGGDGSKNDQQGICAATLLQDGTAVVLEDATVKLSPAGWGDAAIRCALRHGADMIVGEQNFGGQMVEHVVQSVAKELLARGDLRVQGIRFKLVTASRNKVQRAEPIAALYERRRVRHAGTFPKLEDEMVLFTPGGYMGERSPNRADALVWALSELMLGPAAPGHSGKGAGIDNNRRRI